MFGLNKDKKDKAPKPFFTFPLEKDIEDEEKAKAMIKEVEKQIHTLKNAIKDGAKPEEYEALGTLLHGYSCLLKLFNHTPTKNNK